MDSLLKLSRVYIYQIRLYPPNTLRGVGGLSLEGEMVWINPITQGLS
jgi:hypothetical protein